MPIGDDGCYFVGGAGFGGQDHDPSVLGYNEPPMGQPSLWCAWEVSDDGRLLRWNGTEKFYEHVAWMRYLIEHFFKPWGCALNGEMEWQGEDEADVGVLKVSTNNVTIHKELKS